MKSSISTLGLLGLGAGLMYILDPDKGKRRRALLQDEAVHISKIARRQLRQERRDLNNRADGTYAEIRSIFRSGPASSDAKLAARIRSKVGRLTRYPRLVTTNVENGWITVSGPILREEADALLDGLSRIRGVKTVEDRLERHDPEEKFQAFQNARRARRLNPEHWSTGKRILATAAGGGLAVYAARRGGLIGQALGTASVGLVTHGLTDKSFKSLVRGDGGFHIQKSIKIDAPLKEVFHLCAHPENFPQFMSHVRLVEKIGHEQYRWTVDSVPGLPLTWETRVTKVEPEKRIIWESTKDAAVTQHGEMSFEKLKAGGTRVYVNMRYTPPAGIFGHAVAAFFRRDPKSVMDDDLLRLKSFIEKGKVPRDAAEYHRTKGGRGMNVSEIMTKDPACCVPQTSLKEVAHLMLEKNCGAIPVVESFESKKPVGVITDRDITIDTVALGKNPLETTAAEVMTYPVISVTPDTNIDDCCKLMEDNMIRRMVVVDKSGRCCGIVAQADIARNAPLYETAEFVKDVSIPRRGTAG